MFFDELLHLRRQRGLHVVGVVLDVVVLQDRLQSSALLFPALLGTRRFGVQFAFGQQRLLRRGQLARFDDLFDCVLNGSALLISFSRLCPCPCLVLLLLSLPRVVEDPLMKQQWRGALQYLLRQALRRRLVVP